MDDSKMGSVPKTIELIEKFEAIKEKYKTLKVELQSKLQTLGVGFVFQDPTNNVVYQIKAPTGTFVNFDPIGYDRTKKVNEKKGSLSIKKAEELGFTF